MKKDVEKNIEEKVLLDYIINYKVRPKMKHNEDKDFNVYQPNYRSDRFKEILDIQSDQQF